jgi:hypothetical protein
MKTFLATDDVLEAIDEVIEALQVEPDERAAFGEAAQKFLGVMAEWSVKHDRTDWPPLSTLVALEHELLSNAAEADDEWIHRAAAVKTVRDHIIWTRAERASMN